MEQKYQPANDVGISKSCAIRRLKELKVFLIDTYLVSFEGCSVGLKEAAFTILGESEIDHDENIKFIELMKFHLISNLVKDVIFNIQCSIAQTTYNKIILMCHPVGKFTISLFNYRSSKKYGQNKREAFVRSNLQELYGFNYKISWKLLNSYFDGYVWNLRLRLIKPVAKNDRH